MGGECEWELEMTVARTQASYLIGDPDFTNRKVLYSYV